MSVYTDKDFEELMGLKNPKRLDFADGGTENQTSVIPDLGGGKYDDGGSRQPGKLRMKNYRKDKLKEWKEVIARGGAGLFKVGLSPTGVQVISMEGFCLGAEVATPELMEELGMYVTWDELKEMTAVDWKIIRNGK